MTMMMIETNDLPSPVVSTIPIETTITTAVSDDEDDYDITMKTTIVSSTKHPSSIMVSQKRGRNNKCRHREVRFKKEESKNTLVKKAAKKVEKIISSSIRNKKTSSLTWYTRQEIKDNYKSIIYAMSSSIKSRRNDREGLLLTRSQKVGEDGTQSCTYIPWFSHQKRKQRTLVRNQMYKIVKAVQGYEVATQTKVPNLLSQLLERHSKPMVQEAVRIAAARDMSFPTKHDTKNKT